MLRAGDYCSPERVCAAHDALRYNKYLIFEHIFLDLSAQIVQFLHPLDNNKYGYD
jgi:hypothetical protein